MTMTVPTSIIIAAVIIGAASYAARQHYQVVYAGGHAYRLDTNTGKIDACGWEDKVLDASGRTVTIAIACNNTYKAASN